MKCIGILPMAGKGSRIQPIAFSKELYPVIYKNRHYAISEFSIQAMQKAKVDEIKLVINPQKIDIVKYYAGYDAPISIYLFNSPSEAHSDTYPLFSLSDDSICLFGLSDTLFSPKNAYCQIRDELEKGVDICLGLFQVPDGSLFDSVKIDSKNNVIDLAVKQNPPLSNWIWGMWGANVKVLKRIKEIVAKKRNFDSELKMGMCFQDLLKEGKYQFKALRLGRHYFDIGTMESIDNIKKEMRLFHFS